METQSTKSVIPVFGFFLLLLLGWFIYSMIGVTKAISTKSWPAASGRVLSAEVKRGTSSKGSAKFIPEITYSYQLEGKEYQSKKYSSTTARGSSIWAKEIVSQYPVNSSLTVFYNPKNHAEAVLEPGLQSDDYWMTLLSSFFFGVVLLGLIQQIKKKRSSPQ
jgi:hypothetical protein